MKLPRIIYYRADLKETNKQLGRLNRLMEAFLFQAYGVQMDAESSVEPPEVSYSSDEQLLKEELEEEMGKAKERADV